MTQPRMTPNALKAGTWAAILACALAFAFPVQAHAWDLSKSTNGIVLSRESNDTSASVNVNLYWNYKPGDTDWKYSSLTAERPNSSTAYNNSRSLVSVVGNSAESIELSLQPGYRLQLVRIALAASPYTELQTFALVNEPIEVSVEKSVPLAVEATVTSQPPMTLDSSVSIDGTLPVSVTSIGSVDSLGLSVALGLGLVLGGVGIGKAVKSGGIA